MYFQQVEEIAQGLKTCTQRVIKPDEYAYEPSVIRHVATQHQGQRARIKWEVDGEYSVSPGRGKLTVLISPCPLYDPPMVLYPDCRQHDECYRAEGFIPLRIRITSIESVRLQGMDESVAKAEGVASVEAYQKLWTSINGKVKGSRWEDNPMVWRLWFEAVK